MSRFRLKLKNGYWYPQFKFIWWHYYYTFFYAGGDSVINYKVGFSEEINATVFLNEKQIDKLTITTIEEIKASNEGLYETSEKYKITTSCVISIQNMTFPF